MSRCQTCEDQNVINTLCQKCKELKELNALMMGEATELPRVDFGEPVSIEEKRALWSVEDEKRMDIIGPNGNDGDHYEHSGNMVEYEHR